MDSLFPRSLSRGPRYFCHGLLEHLAGNELNGFWGIEVNFSRDYWVHAQGGFGVLYQIWSIGVMILVMYFLCQRSAFWVVSRLCQISCKYDELLLLDIRNRCTFSGAFCQTTFFFCSGCFVGSRYSAWLLLQTSRLCQILSSFCSKFKTQIKIFLLTKKILNMKWRYILTIFNFKDNPFK